MTYTPQEVIGKLAELEPDEIARLMRDERITGVPALADHCPVTNYIRRETEIDRVISTRVVIYGPSDGQGALSGLTGARWRVDTPSTVEEFIKRFDELTYPDLVKRPTEIRPLT